MSLSPEIINRVEAFVDEHGESALLRALQAGHLFGSDQRPLTGMAIKHSADYAAAELPHMLIIRVDPKAKFEPNRVQATLVTGKVAVELPFESVSA